MEVRDEYVIWLGAAIAQQDLENLRRCCDEISTLSKVKANRIYRLINQIFDDDELTWLLEIETTN